MLLLAKNMAQTIKLLQHDFTTSILQRALLVIQYLLHHSVGRFSPNSQQLYVSKINRQLLKWKNAQIKSF